MGVTRGCGSRVPGGLYCVCRNGPIGKPIEHFLLDPPIKMDANGLGLSPKGVRLIQDKDGIYHILDWVGSKFYPNVADFIEEVRLYGLSRRLSSRFEFLKLTHKSRIILLHERAYIENADRYRSEAPCIRQEADHEFNNVMCGRLWWEDVEGGESPEGGRKVTRHMPAFDYQAMSRPEGVKPKYALAAFASFPIHGLEVVRDQDGGRHEKAIKIASQAQLDVSLVDE